MKKFVYNRTELKIKLRECLDKYKDGETWILDFLKKPEKRKLSQNNLFHMWVTMWCKSQGEGRNKQYFETVKYELKKMFLPIVETKGLNGVVRTPKHTSDLSKEEFTNFLNDVLDYFACEWSFKLPLPEDRYFEEAYQAYRE